MKLRNVNWGCAIPFFGIPLAVLYVVIHFLVKFW